MKLFFKTSSNYEHEYQIAVGSTISECLNEELDSATVILVQVPSEHRLTNIAPYDECVIYDENKNHTWYFLINQYEEKELNLKLHVYQYTIELMSETKLFEKIQLPNRQFLHSNITAGGEVVYQSQKTIGEAICELLELYVPKVKFTSDGIVWSYRPVITWNENTIKSYFTKPLKDCSMSQPTLRQALTSIMSQVGCLPRINHRVFTWLDFNESHGNFAISDGLNYVERSNSAGNYANRLVNMGENILDQDNIVVDEILCFRDFSSVFLKQKENLVLNTQYPIYNVQKLQLNMKALFGSFAWESNFGGENQGDFPFISSERNGNNVYIFAGQNCYNSGDSFYNVRIFTLQYSPYPLTAATWINIKFTNVALTATLGTVTPSLWTVNNMGGNKYCYKTVSINLDQYAGDPNVIFVLAYQDANGKIYYDLYDATPNVSTTPVKHSLSFDGNINQFFTFLKCDITPLCVESEKRKYLSVDYTAVHGDPTIDTMKTNYYGTVEYSIGSNKITGFSGNYTIIADWFGNETVTIAQLIWESVRDDLKANNYSKISFESADDLIDILNIYTDYQEPVIERMQYLANQITNGMTPFFEASISDIKVTGYLKPDEQVSNYFGIDISDGGFSSIESYALELFFSIRYEALNTLRSHYEKNSDIPLPIEQLDTQESGITSFEALELAERDKINRLGEEAITINQRASIESEINEVGSIYNVNYTVFKRTISVNHNHFDVNYAASKNYVIKNYSTAIQTKYRAYAYVNINQSIERKENDTVYVYIGAYHYEGDYKIGLEGIDAIDFFKIDTVGYKKLSYGFTRDEEELTSAYIYFKNQMSVLTGKNLLILSQRELTNSQGALYVDRDAYDYKKNLGIPQTWDSYTTGYYEKHEVGFLNQCFYYSLLYVDPLGDYTATQLIQYSNILITSEGSVLPSILTLQDDNTDGTYNKTYYKDWSELINQTLQFKYIINVEGIKLSDDYFNYISLTNRDDFNLFGVVYDNGELSDDEYAASTKPENLDSLLTYGTNSFTFKNLSGHTDAKIVKYRIGTTEDEITSSYTNPVDITVNIKVEPSEYYEYHATKIVDISSINTLLEFAIIGITATTNLLQVRVDSYSIAGNNLTIRFTIYSSSPISIARQKLLVNFDISYSYKGYLITDLLYADCAIVSGQTYYVMLNDTRTHKVYSIDTESGLLVLNYELSTNGTLFEN